MNVGFTGTRRGLTPAQEDMLKQVLRDLQPSSGGHGCCEGGDRVFHSLMHTRFRDLYPVFNEQVRWALEHRKPSDTLYISTAMGPISRNHKIVDRADVVVGCPRGMVELVRSGTWATLRYARKEGKPVHVVWPDGTSTEGWRK